jgi:hypothetical protein
LQSENIEDRRGEHFDALAANTEELKRLNDHLSGVAGPIGGYGFLSGGGAGGGIARLGLGGAGGITLPGVGGIDASGTGLGSLGGIAQRLGLSLPGDGGGGALAGGGGDGGAAQTALQGKLESMIKGSPLKGVVPSDAARYGIQTGSAAEWASLMTGIAGKESGFDPRSHGDVGKFGGAGSLGLFQLSPQDAITYGLQKTPFTRAQLMDPDVNARAAVAIMGARVRAGGIGGPRGAAAYWAGPRGYLARGMVSARPSGPAGDPTVPGDILAQARHVALAGGSGAVERFMAAQGYPKAGNWCGEFAASVVKAAGYTPPAGAAVASNWRRFGTADPVPHVGDIAVANRGVATGATGSHVTFVESYDPTTGRFTGLGGNQRAGFESSFAASGYTFRRPPDREALNRGALNGAMTHRVEGTGSLDVNVSAPAGTRVAAQGGGLFKTINMTRQTQMEHAQGGPSTPAGTAFGGP